MPATDSECASESGAPDTEAEIDVTREMIAAGVRAYLENSEFYDRLQDIVVRIYRAMALSKTGA
jgi:hypothetical protein